MPLNADSLRKVLELEQKKGYADSAVFGGLNRFLKNWWGENSSSVDDPLAFRRLRQLVKSDYASLDSPQRQKMIDEILDWLCEAEKGVEDKPEGRQVVIARRTRRDTPGGKTVQTVDSSGHLLSFATTGTPGGKADQSLDSPISVTKGVGPAMVARFNRLGVRTVRDLLYYFPRRHLDYSQTKHISEIKEGEEETIVATVWEAGQKWLGRRRGTEAVVGDETGNMRVAWFNNPYMAKKLKPNARVVLSGRVRLFGGRPVFESPECELLEDKELIHTARLVPLYPLTEGLYPRQVRKLMKGVVDQWAALVPDFLPPEISQRCHLLGLSQALSQAHFPEDGALKDRARVRLAFDELFLLQIGVLGQKRSWQEGQAGNSLDTGAPVLGRFVQSLPFSLTAAQRKVMAEMLADLKKTQPMCRLLQGDVGSGKTVVAVAGLLVAAASGYQGALMAPTEILAEQHFTSIGQMLSRAGQEEATEPYLRRYSGLLQRPLTMALLVGDTAQSRKRDIRKRTRSGEIDIVIGTHALIQKGVVFSKLGVAVVDEQHRFGVEQRSMLRQKGACPHVLVMTATPIPRTLALTLYGDLDLSVINQLPPGRQAVRTKWLSPGQRETAYGFVRKQVAAGRQAFVICPLVEESEAVQAKSAVAEHERLSREVFPDLRLGLLHGRMSAAEKDGVMRRFRAAELDILVSTAVVEVGIDVPNATVMLVESADRFGLSQLHQFRGRVGRGTEPSYCMLLAEQASEVARQRLDIIESTHDGFVLAEADLKLRGPGEFFGTRQSGLPDLRMARLSDVALLETARAEALALFKKDPRLERPEHRPLAKELARVWQASGEWS